MNRLVVVSVRMRVPGSGIREFEVRDPLRSRAIRLAMTRIPEGAAVLVVIVHDPEFGRFARPPWMLDSEYETGIVA